MYKNRVNRIFATLFNKQSKPRCREISGLYFFLKIKRGLFPLISKEKERPGNDVSEESFTILFVRSNYPSEPRAF